MTLNDLEPSTLHKRIFSKFSQFLDAVHILTLNCDGMVVDRPKQFSALNVNFNDTSRYPQVLGDWRRRASKAATP